MSFVNSLIFKIKRSNSPVFRFAKKIFVAVFNPTVPPLPRFLRAPLRAAYEFHFLVVICYRGLLTIFYRNPLFQGRCASFGKRVGVEGLPYVSGHVEIHVGDDVQIGGRLSIASGGIFGQPKLILKDRCAIGWLTTITVNSEIVIEEDVIVSYDCRISDSDAHPREADLRAAGGRPDPKDVKPVRLCRYAFIGNGSHIMKGVTIGEGATVGANSVVISDVPPYTLVMGNPAEVILRNYGRPSTARKSKGALSPPPAVQ
jgi:acetyltransferase-like isoleucine patch superfamily enzyme